jgi:hypothetical protein
MLKRFHICQVCLREAAQGYRVTPSESLRSQMKDMHMLRKCCFAVATWACDISWFHSHRSVSLVCFTLRRGSVRRCGPGICSDCLLLTAQCRGGRMFSQSADILGPSLIHSSLESFRLFVCLCPLFLETASFWVVAFWAQVGSG